MPELVQLVVEVTPKGIKDAQQQLADLAKTAGVTEKSTSTMMDKFRNMQAVMQGPVAAFNQVKAAMVAVYNAGKQLVDVYGVQERAVSNLEAVLKSTGNTVGLTTSELQDMASEFQKATTFGDEAIIGMNAILLGFRNITGDQFKRTTQGILDMSTVMGTDLPAAANMLGKALDSPKVGITALSRVGFIFTDQQKEMVKVMEESGDLLGAQNIILEEVEKAFGGAAAAAGGLATGSFKQLGNAIGDLKERFGKLLAEGLEPYNRAMTDAISNALSLGDTVRNIFNLQTGTADAGKAVKDLEAIIKLAETNRKEFDRLYVSKGQLALSSDKVLESYRNNLEVAKSLVQQEQLRLLYAERTEALNGAKNTEVKEQPWQTKLGDVTGISALGKSGAAVVDEYIQALMRGAELAVSFGDDISSTLTKTQSAVRETIEALLASSLFTEDDMTIKALRKHYDGLGMLGKQYAATAPLIKENTELTTAEIRKRDEAALATLRQRFATDERNKYLAAEAELMEEARQRAEAYAQAMSDIAAALDQALMNAYVESFKALGKGLVEGTLSAESFGEAMKGVGLALLDQLPLLFLSAGLQAIVMGNWPLGLALMAASGLSAIASGAISATQNAHGNAFGWEGMQAFAKGAGFANSIVSSPTMFAYGGSNLGIMGEAGPEAVMPLTRMPSGNLGVEASGGQQAVIVQIIDQTTKGVDKSTEETTGPNGEKMLRVMLRDAVKASAVSGDLDGAMQSRYGVKPVGVRRS